jgi:2-polyprenyl-6-methoxyphenol hydroxylase-like FAD-dependent oxidoreductase
MTEVAVVGAGPVGLTLAGRLAQQGIAVTVFEAAPRHAGEGSRALCMQRETLEIWDRLGIGERVARRGVQWRIGRTYFRDRELFSVNLPETTGDRFPPFVNISQTEVETMLLARLAELGVPVRWSHRLTGIRQGSDVELTFEDGSIERATSAVGADGAHSAVRRAMGLSFEGHTFEDRFLIADVRAELPYPAERRFFFDPPWNPGRQVLIHPQPDGVWRIDWQVPSDTDAEAERANGGLERRIRAVIGPEASYELVWLTGYRFSQRLAPAFRVGRVFLAGDAAHVMSPFGARGLNSGAGDAEDLAVKLGAVLRGEAAEGLLDSYDTERRAVAAENLAVTDATMRFMVPHGPWHRAWRNGVLRLSPHLGWARRRVNSGRLAEPTHPGRIGPRGLFRGSDVDN